MANVSATGPPTLVGGPVVLCEHGLQERTRSSTAGYGICQWPDLSGPVEQPDLCWEGFGDAVFRSIDRFENAALAG